MSGRLVLDAEAFLVLGGRRSARQVEVRAAMRSADRLGREVVVPTVVLAELYRGPQRNALLDACLSRETAIATRDTDRKLARLVGGVLAGARAGSADIVDAHVVATVVEAGSGVVMSGDPDDMERLSAPYPNVVVVPLP